MCRWKYNIKMGEFRLNLGREPLAESLYCGYTHNLIPSKVKHFLTSWVKKKKNVTASETLHRFMQLVALCDVLRLAYRLKKKKKHSVFYYSYDGHAKKPWCEVSSRFILLQLQHTKPVTTLQYSFIKQEIAHHYLTVSTASFFVHC